ncbi:MAG: response regulator transcription factor [Solirubrobacterales bacterium]
MSSEGHGLRVLVVDDHDVVQWGFRLLLERQSWVERCLAASEGTEAVEICRRVHPEVALVDMLLGTESGAEVCEEIRAASPGTRVLLVSGAGVISPSVARSAGASGFISKDSSAVDVVKAVRTVSLGTEVFADPAAFDSPLSEREQQVLSLIATGSTNKEIAAHLHLSPHTVKEHTSAIYRKLGVRNRAEATRQAQRLKILV